MKLNQKDLEKPIWDQMRSQSGNGISGNGSQTRPLPKLLVWLILFVSVTYFVYTLKLVSTPRGCDVEPFSADRGSISTSTKVEGPLTMTASINVTSESKKQTKNESSAVHRRESQETRKTPVATDLQHIVFGIGASAKLWKQRKEYIKIWYKEEEQMRGIVWMDDFVHTNESEKLPPIRVSSDTSQFPFNNKQGHRSAIRISRIVSETLRLGLKNVRWFVMGDDDTVFITENLVRVLRKYDHNQYYYIGSLSESHLQNIFFSYGMAYGGGGFAISYPLAKALFKMQDRCIHRYPGLYGSDDRIQACMAELGVPLTKELGFHQVSHSLSLAHCFLFLHY